MGELFKALGGVPPAVLIPLIIFIALVTNVGHVRELLRDIIPNQRRFSALRRRLEIEKLLCEIESTKNTGDVQPEIIQARLQAALDEIDGRTTREASAGKTVELPPSSATSGPARHWPLGIRLLIGWMGGSLLPLLSVFDEFTVHAASDLLPALLLSGVLGAIGAFVSGPDKSIAVYVLMGVSYPLVFVSLIEFVV